MHPSSKFDAVVPDPVELQRRLDEDKMTAFYLKHIEAFKMKQARRRENNLKNVEALKRENEAMSKERARLLHIMNRNESKIRVATEVSLEDVLDPQLIKIRRQISIRKRAVKSRYISELLCKRREEMRKALPLKDIAAQPPKPTP